MPDDITNPARATPDLRGALRAKVQRIIEHLERTPGMPTAEELDIILKLDLFLARQDKAPPVDPDKPLDEMSEAELEAYNAALKKRK